MPLSSTDLQRTDAQVREQDIARLRNGRFAKGHSGNPRGHKTFFEKLERQKVRERELYTAIVAETGATSALQLTLARAAAKGFARADFIEKPGEVLALTRNAAQLCDRIRASVAAAKAAKPISAFDQYLQQRERAE